MSTSPDTSGVDRLLRAGTAILVFLVVLALFPYVRDPAIDAKILVYTWGAGILTVVCVVWRALHGMPFRRPVLFHGILLVFLALFAVSGVLSSYVGNSIQEISKFLALYLLYIVASQVYRTPEQAGRLMLVACSAVGLSVAYGILQHEGWDPFPWNPSMTSALEEAPGTFGNGNIASHATVLGTVMAVYIALSQGRRYWYLGFVALYFVHLDLSNQRGGIVGIAAAGALVVLAVVLHRRLKHPRAAIFTSVILLGVLGAAAIAGVMALKMYRTGVPYPISLPILLRYHGYSGASKMILEHPLLGYGPGNYRYENPAFWTPFEQEHFALKHKMNYRAHNDALEIGTEGGLAAAGLYLTFLFMGIYYGLLMGLTDADARRRKAGLFFAAFFCTFMVDGLFGFNLRAPVSAMLLFLMAGALEGVWSDKGAVTARQGMLLPAQLGLASLALALVVIQTVSFASEIEFQRGLGAMYYKAFDKADPILAEGESLTPWKWEFAYQRGEAALRAYKPDEAIGHYERALRMNPYFPPLYVALAHAHVMLAEIGMTDRALDERMKILDKAAEYARRALELCPPLAEGEDVLGRSACLRAVLLTEKAGPGKDTSEEVRNAWEEGAQHLRRAISDKVQDPDRVYLMLGRAEMALNDKLAAQDAFVRAVTSNPANASAWSGFMHFAYVKGQQRVFRDALTSAVSRLRREGKEVPADLEVAATALGKDAAGLRAAVMSLAQTALAPRPNESGTSSKADFTWTAELILEEASSAETSKDDLAFIQYYAALTYMGAAKWQQTSNLFEACWKLLPPKELAECAIVWTQALGKLNQPDQAVAVLREAISQTGDSVQLQLTLARALAKIGRGAEARIEYEFLLNRFGLQDKDRKMVQGELDALSSGPK
jgi:tetratricopeptide (TPR) repeat protein